MQSMRPLTSSHAHELVAASIPAEVVQPLDQYQPSAFEFDYPQHTQAIEAYALPIRKM
jgi:hypothetical protein